MAAKQTILVTGAAGFIGMRVAEMLLARGDTVVGIDALTPYYDPALKRARLARLTESAGFRFFDTDLTEPQATMAAFDAARPDAVVHLAAQPGVRASIDNPLACIRANCDGFASVLEAAHRHDVRHLVFASSSSVYGANRRLPYATDQAVDHPVSLYAASKKANELMAHAYAHVHRLPVTGLRFFTVYGPWGRPDMAVYGFTRAIFEGRPIRIFNHGHMKRDFTYIDDVAEGVLRTLDRPAAPDPAWRADAPDPATSDAPYRLYNIGNSQPVGLLDFVAELERACGRPAIRELLPMQPGDVLETSADTRALERDVGFRPATPLGVGLDRFVAWFRAYHGV